MSIQKCSADAVRANAVINSFIESKKLTLSKTKCNRIHISKKNPPADHKCPVLKVHESEMTDSNREKYLGDIVDKTGKIRATVEERQKRGYAAVAEILAILEEIPLGEHKMEIGLQLRQAMLLNGMLFNSEVWHSISDYEIGMLEKVDEHLLRALVQGHSKLPIEFLYLEAGAMPIRFIISCRRLLYHQTILKRPEEELIMRVYTAQKSDPLPGDFFKLVSQDYQLIGETMDEEYIQQKCKDSFKKEIKEKTKKAAFKYLKELQSKHSKVVNIQYSKLETQPYMKSPIFNNEEVNLLHALRARYVNVKANFSSKYPTSMLCPLCLIKNDDQPHILECSVLKGKFLSRETNSNKVVYEDIFADPAKQKGITHLFIQLLKIRNSLLDDNLCLESAPSTSDVVPEDSDNLQSSIVHSLLGNSINQSI